MNPPRDDANFINITLVHLPGSGQRMVGRPVTLSRLHSTLTAQAQFLHRSCHDRKTMEYVWTTQDLFPPIFELEHGPRRQPGHDRILGKHHIAHTTWSWVIVQDSSPPSSAAFTTIPAPPFQAPTERSKNSGPASTTFLASFPRRHQSLLPSLYTLQGCLLGALDDIVSCKP